STPPPSIPDSRFPSPHTRRRFLAVLATLLAACDPREFARRHGARLRLSVATGPTGGVYYVYGGGIAKVISAHVPNVEATAEVTSASVDNLKLLRDGKVDLALTLATTAADAEQGGGAFERFGRVPVAALAVLYTQYTHLVTLDRTGVARLADLRGRVVALGGPGSGTEDIALRILRASGLDPARDLRAQGLGVNAAADALKDGKIDAFFWSSGLPAGALLDLASTPGRAMRLVPNDDALEALRQAHGAGLYHRADIPAGAYPGLERDVPTVATTTLLVVDRGMPESLAYDITRALFDHRDELAAIHPEARNLTMEAAAAGAPVPYHPGAERAYREWGVWPA
ncbi:MAG TPA: TAXI family TRAP transporter solute-binding subunit, partial [Gemmatimonadaceae bacterium]|nr:TAXI family TRAP transporter solute-binding subunit [Gemmatimonadaceae bacterium]